MNVQLLNTIYTLVIGLLILLLGVNTLLAFWPLKGKSSYFSRETKQDKNNTIVKISSFLWRKKYRQLKVATGYVLHSDLMQPLPF